MVVPDNWFLSPSTPPNPLVFYLPFSPYHRPHLPIPQGALVYPVDTLAFRSLPCPHSFSTATSWDLGARRVLRWVWQQAQGHLEGNSWFTSMWSNMGQRRGTDFAWAHLLDSKESPSYGKEELQEHQSSAP